MKLNSRDLKTIYQQATARPGRTGLTCPMPDALVRVAVNETTADERDQIAEHLASCSDCTKEYQGAREAARSLRAAIDRSPGLWPWTGRAVWVAAAFLAIALGLGIWTITLRQQNTRLQAFLDSERQRASEAESQITELRDRLNGSFQPHLNVPIVDLYPAGAIRSGAGSSAQTIELPLGVLYFTIIINLAGQANYPDYQLEILDADGTVIWNGRGLKRTGHNTFTLVLNSRILPAGTYRFKLHGLLGERKEAIEDYPIEIRYK